MPEFCCPLPVELEDRRKMRETRAGIGTARWALTVTKRKE
jgi:hypothetical protein